METRRRPRIDMRSIMRLLLAHHPRCHPYRNDVYRIRGTELCMGCFTCYPVAILVFALLWLLATGPWWAWAGAGVLTGSVQLSAIVGWTRTPGRKIGVKALLGAGIAATAWAVLAAPWALAVQMLVLAGLVMLASLAMIPRGVRMRRTCTGCFYQGDWERCPGMALVRLDPTIAGRSVLRESP